FEDETDMIIEIDCTKPMVLCDGTKDKII
ncbi:unnamed protein product, partial [Rotaria sp. Silwood2]